MSNKPLDCVGVPLGSEVGKHDFVRHDAPAPGAAFLDRECTRYAGKAFLEDGGRIKVETFGIPSKLYVRYETNDDGKITSLC